MITLTMDVEAVNQIANHPDVRPFLGGEGPADLGPLMDTPGSLTFWIPEGGVFILHAVSLQVYNAHSLFLPWARRYSRQAMRDVLGMVFRAGAKEIWTMIPDGNRAAAALAKLGGFSQIGFCDRMFPVPGGPVAVTTWALTRDAWVAREERNRGRTCQQ